MSLITEALTRRFTNLQFSYGGSIEAKIDRVLEERPTRAKRTELLALAPVVQPHEGAGRMLYEYAFNPAQVTHPLHEAAVELFNYQGKVPPEKTPEVAPVSGIIEKQENGGISSPIVVEIFSREKAASTISQLPPQNTAEGYAGKALQLKRIF